MPAPRWLNVSGEPPKPPPLGGTWRPEISHIDEMGDAMMLQTRNALTDTLNNTYNIIYIYTMADKDRIKNYFASSDPHHDISKQLVDTTFV